MSNLPPVNVQALLGGLSQDTRLLQLSTPLGPDQLIPECVRGEEGIGHGFRFQVSALSTDAGIALKSLIGQPALLQLLNVHSRDDLRPFHGHITAVEMSGANGGLARYHLTLEPWTAFLAHDRDSRVFQNMSVFDILDCVFGPWQGKGRLSPAWRFDINDRAAYPIRSLTTQYQESDLAFAERLMNEEGLFHYYEHAGDPDSPSLGCHTLVIADHNASFKPNKQSSIEFTQSSAVMRQDGLDRWRTEMRRQTDAVEISSWDYRTLNTRPVSAADTGGAHASALLTRRDVLGAYGYETRSNGQRKADVQLQALTARKEVHVAAGTVRTLSAGTTFTVHGQPQLDELESEDERNFLVLRMVHLMHNNLSAEIRNAAAKHLQQGVLGAAMEHDQMENQHAGGERPLYRMRIDAIRSSTPYRGSSTDEQGRARYPRPVIGGQQSAVVVGPVGSAVHTDRDHRIKVQFHWQRGAQSHNRLDHPSPSGHTGAPADDSAGTWVRVATPMAPVAGANWGSVAIARVGQEVLIDFLDGDIDRPVVIGSLYNGKGAIDAQHNRVSAGTGPATGNAPAWFPGESGAHAHPAVLSGYKSQAMGASQRGDGAYSQLVFDDTAGQSRVALQRHALAHQGTAELNLGHLLHQTDNQRLASAGFGAELKTEHSAAVRAGKGLLLSAYARNGGCGSQLDSREAKAQLDQSTQLLKELSATARKHNAVLKGGDAQGEAAAGDMPAIEQMEHSGQVIGSSGGGKEETTAFSEPHMQLSSPAGFAATTPASAIFCAGNTSSIVAGQDINFASQGNSFHAVRAGISLFTYGKAGSKDNPNQETGIKLHAASGKVSCQSQSGETNITADKSVTVASITKGVSIAAREHVMLTAQGAYIKLEGGNIMVHGPGKMEFKASMKELAGPKSSAFVPPQFPCSVLAPTEMVIEHRYHDDEPLAGARYEALFSDGTIRKGVLDGAGRAVLTNTPGGPAKVKFGPMPGPFARKDLTPTPQHKPNPSTNDIDSLIDKYTQPGR